MLSTTVDSGGLLERGDNWEGGGVERAFTLSAVLPPLYA